MRMVIVSFVFLVLQSSTGKALSQTKPGLQLVLSLGGGPTEVVSGHEFRLDLTVRNMSKQDVDCTYIEAANVNLAYRYDIRKENGESLREVHHGIPTVHDGGCVIKPGETNDVPVSGLMSAYGMQEPGVYTVQVSRQDPTDPKQWDRSNTVRVIVKAAPGLRLVLSIGNFDFEGEVATGHEFTLDLKVTNMSKQDISCALIRGGNNLNMLYSYDIRKENGEAVKQIHHYGAEVHAGGCVIKPGETDDVPISGLMSAYGMQEPGVYTVRVSRQDPTDPKQWDRSNIVNVVVKTTQ